MMAVVRSFAIGETQVISQQITSIIWSLRITNAGPPTACICLEGHSYQIWSYGATHTTTKYRH